MSTPRPGTPQRVGLIVPSSNVTMETEIPALLSRHPAAARRGVTFHSSRATLHRVDPESLQRMVTESDRCARELADARLDVVAYACLIAIMASGPGAHEAEEQRLAAALAGAGSPVPVTSSAGALVRALQRLGASRVAIVAPYLKPLTGLVVRYLADYGIEVVDSVSLEVADNVEVGAGPRPAARARAAAGPGRRRRSRAVRLRADALAGGAGRGEPRGAGSGAVRRHGHRG